MPARVHRALLALVLIGAVLIAGCGEDEQGGVARLAPPDAPLFAELSVRPGDEDAEAIRSLLDRVGAISDPAGEIQSALDESLADNGLDFTYEADVAPWLGERAGFFVRSFEPTAGLGMPEFAALIEVTDTGAAQAFVDRVGEEQATIAEQRGYGGFEYLYGSSDGGYAIGVVDDTLVIGTEASFQVAVDALEGESLAESSEYRDRVEALGDDQLATVFLRPSTVVDAAIASEDISREDAELIQPLLAGPLAEPVAAGLSATPESASLEFVSFADDADAIALDPTLIGRLPAGSWLALATPELGETIIRSLDQFRNSGLPGAGMLERAFRQRTGLDLEDDIAGWLGDVTAFVRGTTPFDISAGVLATTADGQAPGVLIEVVRSALERELPQASIGPAAPGTDPGFSIELPELGRDAGVGVLDSHVVAAVGISLADAFAPSENLGDDERFGAAVEALGDGYAPGLFLYLPSALLLAELGGAGDDPEYAAAAPYLDALGYLVAGNRIDGNLVVQRLSIGVE